MPISTRSIQCFGRASYSLCGVLLVASSAVLALGYSEHGPITSDPTISGRPEPKVTDGARANLSAKIRVQSTLVLIPVTVVDPQYHFVAGLKRDDFRLFEDQVEQNIVQCSIEDAPVSVGLIVDRSGSMGGKMDQARLAAAEFLKTANRRDEFFIVFFSDQLELASDFSTATEEIQHQLFSALADGRTALLDAVYYASQRIRRGSATRKALVLISDGDENSSRYTEFEVRNLLQESDAQLFAIGLYRRVPADTEHREALIGRTLMTRLAEVTGGFQYPVQNLNELPQVAATISALMRNQYILSYRPTNQQADGKYRRVTVKLAQPAGRAPCRPYWRAGYYAPDLLH